MLCTEMFLTFRTISVHNMISPCSAKRRASDKDLPVFPLFPMSSPASRSANKLTWPELSTQNVC